MAILKWSYLVNITPHNITTIYLIYSSSSCSTANWYKLISVILHFGDAYNGHFTVFRRSPRNPERWVYLSDQEVKYVSTETVMNSYAYMLFYEKLDLHTLDTKATL